MKLWEQPAVFPVIASIIESQYSLTNECVRHNEIAKCLASDADSEQLIAMIVEIGPDKDAASVASKMVDWFSKNYSEGRFIWAREFDRVPIENGYAYRPRLASDRE